MKRYTYYSVDDFVSAARKRIPKSVFDFIEGGAGNEDALKRNVSDFKKILLLPHIRSSAQMLDLSSDALGCRYSAPFGIAPMGMSGLIHPNAEIILSKAAAKFGVPYIISAASNKSIEAVSKASGVPPWFQLYIPKCKRQLDVLLGKADANCCPVLVLTVDSLVAGRRLRDLRNEMKFPYRLGRSNIAEAIKYPIWNVSRTLSGKLTFPIFGELEGVGADLTFGNLMSLQTGGDLDWQTISSIRQKWKGKLVLKGVLSETDALRANRIGVDAVVISNHGGRQLNSVPSPISVLPRFSGSGLKSEFLMLDSGIRSGEDIIISLSQGASFVFMGRMFLYALAANGEEGVDRIFQIIFEELAVGLKLVGVDSPCELGLSHFC